MFDYINVVTSIACSTLKFNSLMISVRRFSNGILQAHKFQAFLLVEPKNKFALKFLSFRCPTLFGETRGSRFKG